jgi:hypothetical protein
MQLDHHLSRMGKIRVRRSHLLSASRPWLAACPCGWTDSSRHWHIVMLVVGHHLRAHTNVSEVCS